MIKDLKIKKEDNSFESIYDSAVQKKFATVEDGAGAAAQNLNLNKSTNVLGTVEFVSPIVMGNGLNMDGSKISDVGDPIEDKDVVNKRYLESKSFQMKFAEVDKISPSVQNLTLDTTTRVTGNIFFGNGASMTGERITSVGDPLNATDAANKEYVDSQSIKFGLAGVFEHVGSYVNYKASVLTGPETLNSGMVFLIEFGEVETYTTPYPTFRLSVDNGQHYYVMKYQGSEMKLPKLPFKPYTIVPVLFRNDAWNVIGNF